MPAPAKGGKIDLESLDDLDRASTKYESVLESPDTVGAYFWGGDGENDWQSWDHVRLISDECRRSAWEPLRLLLSAPPQHGKSLVTSWAFPLWYILLFPERAIIHTSYAKEFAVSIGSRPVRETLLEHGEEWGVRVHGGTSSRQDDWRTEIRDEVSGQWKLTHKGGMKSVGIGGPITGRGAHLLLGDDVLKNEVEASSEIIRGRHKNWWKSVVSTRLQPRVSSVALIGTRWHEDDLIGFQWEDQRKKLAENPNANIDRWELVNLPAIAENESDPLGREPGTPLCPERYGSDELARKCHTVGPYFWAAMYQGNPTPGDGMFFRRQYFRYYEKIGGGYVILHTDEGPWRVSIAQMRKVLGWDGATKVKSTNDFSVAAILGVLPWGPRLWWDLWRDRIPVPDQYPQLKSLVARHRPARVGIEDKDSGQGLIQFAQRDGMRVEALGADTDKGARAAPFATAFRDGDIWLPLGADWLDDVEKELTGFPFAAHDDIVDAASHAYSLTPALVITGMIPPAPTEETHVDGVPRQFADKFGTNSRGIYDR